jgi:hypothetical protein
MPDRRGRRGRSSDLLPDDRLRWAEEIWADPQATLASTGGVWMLREAARLLGLPEEAVDELLRGSERR